MRADPVAGRQPRPDAGPLLTHVELTWLEGRIEHWIRFGHDTGETILDRRRRVLSFAPRSVFAFVRWASNDFGTIISRIDIVRAIDRGESYQTLPFVRPGGDILLRISGWPPRRRRAGAALQPRPASRVAAAPEARAMTRFGWVITTYVATLAATLSAFFHPLPKLIWNASGSVPIGLYAVHPARALRMSELVVVQPPEALARFLDERHYLPFGVPLVKHVLALPGQTVCRTARVITVDGAAMGEALERDRFGRALPAWQGCRVLGTGEVFLMNRTPPDSLDGRYFGPLPTTAIVGRADPIWTFAEN